MLAVASRWVNGSVNFRIVLVQQFRAGHGSIGKGYGGHAFRYRACGAVRGAEPPALPHARCSRAHTFRTGDVVPAHWRTMSELPDRAVRAHAGETMFAPADTPMKLNMLGPGKRDALFIIVHDSSKPTTTFLDWKPKGLCQK